MSEDVLIVSRDGAVATLTMNRPRAKNALNKALLEALAAGLRSVAEDPAVRAIVLTGAGGAFCAGADLKAAFSENPNFVDQLDATLDVYHSLIRTIAAAPKPVVAAVDGPAVGFGCDLALACDLRIASNEAYFQEKFVKIGLMPDGGGTFWLPRLVGLARAMEIMMLGEAIPAARALEFGLVNRVVAPSELSASAHVLAQSLASGPPLALAGMKRATREALGGGLESALAAEKQGQLACLRSNDCLEGVAAWMQKRDPEFQGR
ncbi:enoyl-CoA hydratase-related protein [Chondromyces crocatus]|uniref:Enoyl-CoA hydratase n=1 Tax=Chondromyces crocatus TaxID=52 RepID=A0A0K1EEG2_CHOCO|nr:enoyl-CoA hydratase-related protein [Chondromyces crocatus]AKT39062.1 enoyl-CoA hydratase [Chondromyces crocatus]